MNGDWLTTARQSLPRLWDLRRRLEPTERLADVGGIDVEYLETRGIRGVIWDVDGTLMEYHAMDVASEFRDQIRSLFLHPTIKNSILSNCGDERFITLGQIFPEIPVVRSYVLNGKRVDRVIAEGRDSFQDGELEALYRDGGYQVRKPDPDLIHLAIREMELVPSDGVVMVGDQYLTDIASANLAGIRSIKVPAWRRDTFPLPVRLSQDFEACLYRIRPRSK